MKTNEFYYDLPQELIAQTPTEKRDSSRLLVLNKSDGSVSHSYFYDIADLFNPGDALILNDSRVLPARLYGTKKESGSSVEFLLLKQLSANRWETLVKPGKKAKKGSEFCFGESMTAIITEVKGDGNRIIEFEFEGSFFEILDGLGKMPLPPYITAELSDKERYQTVYSNEPGSAAAPTAGLHFTPQLLQKIMDKGVLVSFVTLHVGLGTFRPVKTDDITEHVMHSEHYEIPEKTAEIINKTKKNDGRVFCVGTTSCRTLESAADENGNIKPGDGWTEIFIYPGYKFRITDGLITNFHLPESTLIMLVSAFAGHKNTMSAYKTAVDEKYRFFSFGDAMLIF